MPLRRPQGALAGRMTPQIIGLLMVVAMLGGIFVGFPISFTLIFLGIVFGYWGFGQLVFYLLTLQFNATMMEQTLAAVPLFVFMGIMMEQANLMERLFDAVQKILAGVRGSLYLAVMFVATIFAAATGIVGASVTVLGIMAGKPMIRSKYDVRLSSGLIAAGGTLGILIPPSIMLVVMGPVLEVPVTTLFAAALLPGVMLATLFTAYAMLRCALNPTLGPPLAMEERATSKAALWAEFFQGLVPPAALVMAALGSIVFGLATPTEGAACGAGGALLLTALYRRLTWKRLFDALVKTLEISVLILFLVAASNFFGSVFARLGTPTMLTDALLGLELNRYVVLFIIMALIFILGWPLEWVPIVLIVVPFLLPLVQKLQFNLAWFGILVAVNLQTAWLSPPVALSAYFLKGVVPEWQLGDIYKGMLQFMGLQLLGLILVIVFPEIALWLPGIIYGK
ncbi:MAG TPA: TRAP transporter large permease subunit [Burkholderiales bacterium]|nr:TRAP transporter large permease subunit [Burkholderiales bacterium]